MNAPLIHGTVAAGFEAVRDAFRRNFEERGELGASLHAIASGETVVDLWAGRADRDGRPWTEDSLAIVFSATKGMAALCLLMLADRGQLDYEQRVAHYWPGFGAHGKERITVRQLLAHRAGLCAIDRPIWLTDLACPERIRPALEAQIPLWEPGTAQGYHGVSFGLYVSELFRQITGENLGAFFQREVAAPLGVDFHIGLPPELDHRVATIYPVSGKIRLTKILPAILTGRGNEGRVYRAFLQKESEVRRAFSNPAQLGVKGLAEHINRPEIRRLELAWMGGFGTARSMAKIYSVLAQGGSGHGVTLVRPETVAMLHPRDAFGFDRVLKKPIGWQLGFVKEELRLFSPHVEAFGHPGAGGALGYADPVRKLGIGYVCNSMSHRIRSLRALALCHALYRCL